MTLVNEIRDYIDNLFQSIDSTQSSKGIEVINRGYPHVPVALPKNKVAVYMFRYKNQFLKIGKVGENSNARFQYQHYKPFSAQSTLAESILEDREMKLEFLDDENVSEWILNNCGRIDIIIDSDTTKFKVDLIEAALHYKYQPKYEGCSTQKKSIPEDLFHFNDFDRIKNNISNRSNDDLGGETIDKTLVIGNPSIDFVREYLRTLISKAQQSGISKITVRSGDIHTLLKMNQAHPTVCQAMTSLGSSYKYRVVSSPPKGKGSNLIHEYYR